MILLQQKTCSFGRNIHSLREDLINAINPESNRNGSDFPKLILVSAGTLKSYSRSYKNNGLRRHRIGNKERERDSGESDLRSLIHAQLTVRF